MTLIGSEGNVQQEERSAQRTIETVVAFASTTDYQFAPRRCISCRKEKLVNDVGDDGDEQDDSYVDADHDEGDDGDTTQENKITRRSAKIRRRRSAKRKIKWQLTVRVNIAPMTPTKPRKKVVLAGGILFNF